jgi:cysteine desulfurase
MIYLDNNATTRTDPDVVRAMLPYFDEDYANPSSLHGFAEGAREALRQSRLALGRLLGCRSEELVFTSGATEAANLAIAGAAEARPALRHVVTTAVEHHAVLHPIERLRARGYEVTVVPVDANGLIRPDDVVGALRPDTLLVAAMLANNETGVLLPIEPVARACRERGVLVLCDATQAVGKMPVHPRRLGVDYLTLSAHKLHGPKGVGALFRRRGAPLVAQLVGGGQQWDIRSGTENVPGIVGLGMAAFLARQHQDDGTYERVTHLRDRLERGIVERIGEVRINGQSAPRLGTTLSVAFRHASGEAMLQHLDEMEIAASSSSACQSNTQEPSHVMVAMGLPATYLHGVLRFGLSRFTTEDEIEVVLERLPRIVERARAASPFRGGSDADEHDRPTAGA